MSGLGEALLVPAYSQHYAQQADAGASLGPPLTLDNITVPALIALSCYRKLRAGYSGSAIRVRRTDTVEQDIGFVAGILDTATLLTFVGAGTGTVTTIYDQGLAGRNLTQANAALQPIIVNAGALVVTTGTGSLGVPSMNFNTSRTLSRADACGLTGAPAITIAGRCKGVNAGYPSFWRTGASALTVTGSIMSLQFDSGANRTYWETKDFGVSFTTGDANAVSNSYIGQAPAGGNLNAYTLQFNGASASRFSFAGASTYVPNISNQATSMGGGLGTGAGVYRDFAGDMNCGFIFNAVLAGADLVALNAELAAHR